MDFLNVLSVAIGMITVSLVPALSVTAFNGAIAALLSDRGKWLRTSSSATRPGSPPSRPR